MGLYRSELMRLYQLTVPKDDAWNVMNEFGDLAQAQFIDLNGDTAPYSLPYTQQIKQTEQSERKIKYLLAQCQRHRVEVAPPTDQEAYNKEISKVLEEKNKAINLLYEDIIDEISKQEDFVRKQNVKLAEAEAALNQAKDELQVMAVAKEMLPEIDGQIEENQNSSMRKNEDEGEALMESLKSQLGHIAGVVDQSDIQQLRKLVFRTTKGKSIMNIRQYANEDNEERSKDKSVYIIVFWDGQHTRNKLQKICDAFSKQRFELPNLTEIPDAMKEKEKAIKDAQSVLDSTKVSLREQLVNFDQINAENEEETKPPSKLYTYKIFLTKERSVYKLINQTNASNTNFIGYFWAPLSEEENIKKRIEETAARVQPYDDHSIPEPTYFQVPEPLQPWYTLIDTYGIPTYGEANPALVSIVWFPFLFGMMFGDLGHGSLLLLFAIYLCIAADSLRDGPLKELVMGRYLFLLMGVFATYCGAVYNEFFAIPLNTFKSCYSLNERKQWLPSLDEETDQVTGEWVYSRAGSDCTYLFGYDPAWGLTGNTLTFSNNIKMKLSVIFGVLHMLVGILTKGDNAVYFRQWATLITEVFTGLVILVGLFGWMDVLIYAKWFYPLDVGDTTIVNSGQLEDRLNQDDGATDIETKGEYDNQHMPSIIAIMVNTAFGFGKPSDRDLDAGFYSYIGGDQQYMYSVGFGLLITVILLIPVMLLAKPCCFRRKGVPNPRDKVIARLNQDKAGDDDLEEQFIGQDVERLKKENGQLRKLEPDNNAKDQEFSDAFINQTIETIEFVLGTVSNTASYLRLWALSLAHSQLSEVFFNLTIRIVFSNKAAGNSIWITLGMVFIIWPIFWSICFAVIMCMDCMECFLHTVRLTWVEFQNKFYHGTGYKFIPYSFKDQFEEIKEQAKEDSAE